MTIHAWVGVNAGSLGVNDLPAKDQHRIESLIESVACRRLPTHVKPEQFRETAREEVGQQTEATGAPGVSMAH
jgi:hypothetical protein